jgi:hypothetical protein
MIEARRKTEPTETGAASKNASLKNAPSGSNIGVHLSVNGVACDRKIEYFHRQLSIANSSGPLWTNVTIASSTTTTNGGFICPDDNQSLTYDLDGNLSFDGVWSYQWDGENRLISMQMTNVTSLANSKRLKLDFAYDYMGRRIRKIVSTWNGSAFASPVTNKFAGLRQRPVCDER